MLSALLLLILRRLCSVFIQVFKVIMWTSKTLFQYLVSEKTVKLCRTKADVLGKHDERCQSEVSFSIQAFVRDFVTKNVKSVTTQIIRNGHPKSESIRKTELGSTKKSWKKGDGKVVKKSQGQSPELSEGASSSKLPHRRQRPNYFVAVQITDQTVLENCARIQDGVLQNSNVDLKHMIVDVRKSHITLGVMHLPDTVAISRASHCLDQCLPKLKQHTDSGTAVLQFEGLSVFNGGRVLFASVKPSSALQSLHTMADAIKQEMEANDIVPLSEDFNPHMTLMKSRWGRKTGAKKVEKEAYAAFEKDFLGSQRIYSIQLCQMGGKGKDAYYPVVHEVSLHE